VKRGLPVILPGLLAGYVFLFLALEQQTSVARQDISPALPSRVLHVLGHTYLNQIIAEALFIKAAVYYGGLEKEVDEDNLAIMEQHFIAMKELHPKMLGTYYRAEAVLAHRGDAYARSANRILEHGRSVLPDQIALPFFEGFNYFRYLKDPARAAEVLRIASEIPGAPQWIGHLASMLAAEGGNIRTGLVWLRGMLASSTDEVAKQRYRAEIEVFEQALRVQVALERYIQNHSLAPEALNELVPEYLAQLPSLKKGYTLEYRVPTLYLKRERR